MTIALVLILLALLIVFFALDLVAMDVLALALLSVALQTANALHLNPRTFAMMIAIAASCSYLTPLEPSCVLVYGPGRYKFADFFKVGAWLTVLIFIVSMLLVPVVWPLTLNP